MQRQFKREQRVPVPVSCNLHPRMRGWVLPRSNPYFAVTDADGYFAIDNLPAGQWEFQLWHEQVGYLPARDDWDKGRLTIRIEPGKVARLGVVRIGPPIIGAKD